MFANQFRVDAELRIMEMRHAGALHALILANVDHLRRWFHWPSQHRTLEETQCYIGQGLQRYAEDGSFVTGIWCREELAGVLDVHRIDQTNRFTSLGYWLGQAYEGQGLMTDACRTVIDFLFRELTLNRVEISHVVENERSRAVIERVGFRYEGMMPKRLWSGDHWMDQCFYGLTREEWEARR